MGKKRLRSCCILVRCVEATSTYDHYAGASPVRGTGVTCTPLYFKKIGIKINCFLLYNVSYIANCLLRVHLPVYLQNIVKLQESSRKRLIIAACWCIADNHVTCELCGL